MTDRLLEAVRIVPPALWRHLGDQLGVAAPDFASLRSMYRRRRTLFEHQEVACETLGFHWLSEAQRRRCVIAMMMLGLTLPASAAEISRFVSSEKAFAVNSWLVPTRTGVVVIDAQFTVSEADQLLDAVKHTGRPLKAIIITHPHPDHFNGTCRLLRLAKVPVYATQATIEGVNATAEAKRAQWKPAYGADYPDSTCAPDHALAIGASWVIDGVTFEARDYGPGESLTESIVLAPAMLIPINAKAVAKEFGPPVGR